MSLRDRLLALLGAPDYQPLAPAALARTLGLSPGDRRKLAHEVRLLVASGEARLVRGDCVALRGDAGLITGRINFRNKGSAFVVPETRINAPGPRATAIQIAAGDTGTALHGDLVAVRVSDSPTGARRSRGPARAAFADEPQGHVSRVVSRAHETIVGTLRQNRKSWTVAPDDQRLPETIAVADPEKGGLRPAPGAGDKVVVRLQEWTDARLLPMGEVIEVLGRQFEPRAELVGVFRKFHLTPEFPAAVLQEAAALPTTVPASDLVGRIDYREVFTFTIDPDDAKDFDDALSLEPLENGELRIGVHIADVSHYVRPGTALDRDAQSRGNSTYLVGTVVPMLPEKLSNGLCSLVEAQDRLTKAVLLTYDPRGRLKLTSFADTVIRSRKRLTYRQAHALLQEDDLAKIRALPLPAKHQTGSTGRALGSLTDDELRELQGAVRQLWKIASRLRRDRLAHGALDLDMPETKIFVNEAGYADRLERIEHDESHQLIEEFMLAANQAVAHLTRQHKLASIYRVHDEPDDDRLAELRQVLATFGLEVGDLTQRGELTGLLEKLRDHPQGRLLRVQLLRSLKKACYRASPDGHFGLHLRDYSHFTSPIRRYADLVVHRVLAHYFVKHLGHPAKSSAAARGDLTVGRLESVAEHLSLTEVNSMDAERESQKIKLLEFFEREQAKPKPSTFEAIITEVRGHGVFIELIESLAFGFVRAAHLGDDAFLLNGAGDAFIGRRTKQRFAVGSLLRVVVAKTDREKRLVDFRVIAT